MDWNHEKTMVVHSLTASLAAFGLATLPVNPADAVVADPAALVNPLLGTSNGGNTFPGAVVPFSMVQWSPDMPSRPSPRRNAQ